MDSFRQSRKLEHIEHSLGLPVVNRDFFKDIHLIHNCVPEVDFSEIDIATNLFTRRVEVPIFINAMTGGAEDTEKVNRSLAQIAKECSLIMAVGSQTAGVEDAKVRKSYEIIRKVYPNGNFFANIGANAPVKNAVEAVEMIGASALQLHLNVPQELTMKEGDQNFRGILENISEIVASVRVPVIVKEVGFGISYCAAKKIISTGIAGIDVGGKGGTDFLAIEKRRLGEKLDYWEWGIPTPISLIEVVEAVGEKGISIIASGGVANAINCVKSLALGADAVGIAGSILRSYFQYGEVKTVEHIEKMLCEIKKIMLMVGAKNIAELKRVPVVVLGFTREWCQLREINLKKYALRTI